GQADGVVAAKQLLHRGHPGRSRRCRTARANDARHLTCSVILCSLAFERVKPRGGRASKEMLVAQLPNADRDPAGFDLDPQKPSLAPLFALLAPALAGSTELSVGLMHGRGALPRHPAGHFASAGGRGLRPMLTLGAARLGGYRGDRHIALAAAVEFIHTATLLHDDVVDESSLRRGRDTANALWGNKPAVLVGDFLFARSFQLMVEDGSLPVLEVLSRTAAIIPEGEVHQLITANDTTTNEAAYLEVIEAKTAALFTAASRIGAVLAARPIAQEEALG